MGAANPFRPEGDAAVMRQASDTQEPRDAGDAGPERAFGFLHLNRRARKPRELGLTEARGPYYDTFGPRHVRDLLEVAGEHVDALKFSGGSFALMPRTAVQDIIEACHEHGVLVSTGGFLEHVLARQPGSVDRVLTECRELGFDVVEVSSGFLSIPPDDLVRLTGAVVDAGLKAKPEVGIQFGAGGDTPTRELEAEGAGDPGLAIDLAKRHLDAGAWKIMVESEGLTENVTEWRTDAIARIGREVGMDHVVFEAGDPRAFAWYVKTYGPDVNLFVDHSQVLHLEALRRGLWGPKSLWGRVVTYKG